MQVSLSCDVSEEVVRQLVKAQSYSSPDALHLLQCLAVDIPSMPVIGWAAQHCFGVTLCIPRHSTPPQRVLHQVLALLLL